MVIAKIAEIVFQRMLSRTESPDFLQVRVLHVEKALDGRHFLREILAVLFLNKKLNQITHLFVRDPRLELQQVAVAQVHGHDLGLESVDDRVHGFELEFDYIVDVFGDSPHYFSIFFINYFFGKRERENRKM